MKMSSVVIESLGIDTRLEQRLRKKEPRRKALQVRISERYLSIEERCIVADMRSEKASLRAIAAELGRSPSTISREIRRNATARGRYYPAYAHRRAVQRRRRPKLWKIMAHEPLHKAVCERLLLRWSPQQISNELKQAFPGDERMRVSPETVYQTLYRAQESGLDRELFARLRRGRKRRKPHKPVPLARGKYQRHLSISQRPPSVENRQEFGHWEGDLIVGPKSRSAIATLVERRSRYLILVPMLGGNWAETLRHGLVEAFSALPQGLRRSLTWDQGIEMSQAEQFVEQTGVPVYFCHPHSPWQRGTNENTNRLLRQYFPKSTNLSVHSPAILQAVAQELNQRPRRTLDWVSPRRLLDQWSRSIGVAS